MNFIFHFEAEEEFLNSINYYEDCEVDLDFSLEVYSSIQHILKFPEAWPVLDGDIRRLLVNRFPYGILYSIEENHIYILAIMPLHRDPDYWKKRT